MEEPDKKSLFSKVRDWFIRHERRISSAALLTGFIVDWFTLKRIDLLFENLVLLSYLALIAGSILVINLFEEGTIKSRIIGLARPFVPIVLQFAFGGIFSAFLVFYSRSASIAASWPFLLILLFLLIGNESFRRRYVRLTFHLSIFFIAFFSFTVFFIPVVLRAIGAGVFILSGVVSIAVISAFIYLIFRITPSRFAKSRNSIFTSIPIIFIVINILYFTNIIPPIPLSLKEAGAYHFIERVRGGDYLVKLEEEKWYDFFIPRDTLHIVKGQPAYFWSSVFAPRDLSKTIVHCWERFDEEKDRWLSSECVRFPIEGGRDGGFRGYSTKSVLSEGLWRVNIETTRGQLIGREKFKVKSVERTPKLIEKTL